MLASNRFAVHLNALLLTSLRPNRLHPTASVPSLASPELVANPDGQVDLSQVDLISQSGLDRPKWTWSAKVDLIGQSGPHRPQWT